jgi:hypothetical protein
MKPKLATFSAICAGVLTGKALGTAKGDKNNWQMIGARTGGLKWRTRRLLTVEFQPGNIDQSLCNHFDTGIGLDLAHRLPLLDLLNGDEFKDWQILLLTYDANWFDMASEHLPDASWTKHRLHANPDIGSVRCAGSGSRSLWRTWTQGLVGTKWNGGDLGQGGFLPFHPYCGVVRIGATPAAEGRTLVVLFLRNRDFFRFVVFAGGDEYALAGCHHTSRWHRLDCRMDLAFLGSLVTLKSKVQSRKLVCIFCAMRCLDKMPFWSQLQICYKSLI